MIVSIEYGTAWQWPTVVKRPARGDRTYQTAVDGNVGADATLLVVSSHEHAQGRLRPLCSAVLKRRHIVRCQLQRNNQEPVCRTLHL